MFVKTLQGYINSKYILSVELVDDFSREDCYAVHFSDRRGEYHQLTEYHSKEKALALMVKFIDYLNGD